MADRRLKVFHTVARLLSFTKAAEVLHMTQPAVTFQIRQLEEQFNTRLFDRTHNRISLTQAGERVFDYAERIIHLYAEMENSIHQLTGAVSGLLVIGASTTIAEYFLPPLLGDFKRRYPGIDLRMRVGNTEGVIALVENNVVDLGVVEGPVANRHLVVELCRMDSLVAVVAPGHPLATAQCIPLNTVMDYPFVSREDGSGTREVIAEHLRSAGLDPEHQNIVLELGSPEAVKGAVESGIGMAIVSRATIDKELRIGSLVSVDLEPPLQRPFSFVFQRQKFRQAAVEKLLEFVRDYCEHSPVGQLTQ